MFTQPAHGRRTRLTVALGVVALVASLALSGCYESSTDPQNTEASLAAIDDLSMTEIVEKVQLSDEQAQALAPALDRYRQNRNDRTRDGRQLHAMQMLADASDVLDADQMTKLVDLIVAKRQERMQQHMEQRRQMSQQGANRRGPGANGPFGGMGPGAGMGPRDGKGPHDGFGPGGLLSQLELTEEQQTQLAALRETQHAARVALFEQFRNGEITQEQLRTAMEEQRAQHQEAVNAILTAEQIAQLEQLRNARALENMERALERLQTRGEERLTLMARILGLDEQQVAAARTLHEESVTALSGIVESLRSGAISADEARQAAQDLRQQSQETFRALLTPEQQTLFDSLLQLQHRRGHGFGARP